MMDADDLTAPETAPTLQEGPSGGLMQHVLRGGVFLVVRQVLSMMLSFIGVLIITRIIGPDRYGAYAAALGIYQYMQNLGQVGIGVYLVRADQPDERDFKVATSLVLIWSLILTALTEVSLPLIESWVHVENMGPMLAVLALSLPLPAVACIASARIERQLDFRRMAIVEMGGQIIYYVFAVPLTFSGLGAWSLVAGWCIQQVYLFFALHIAAKRWPEFDWDKAVVRKIVAYTIGFSTANWLWQIRSLINPFIVGHFLNAEAVGQVGIGIRLLELLSFVKNIAWRLSIAALARVQHQPQKLIEAVTHGMHMQLLALAPILLAFAWFGDFLLPLMFGPRWLPVMQLYPFLALSYLTNAQFNTHSSVLYVLRRNVEVSLFHIAHVILFAGTAWFAVQQVGLIGYGWGEAVALLAYIAIHIFTHRSVGSPDYRVSLVWWAASVVGLFWRYEGAWAIAVPFAALFLWPASWRQLKFYLTMLRGGVGLAR